MKALSFRFSLLLLLAACTGCSLFNPKQPVANKPPLAERPKVVAPSEPAAPTTARVPIENLDASKIKRTNVEILWEIPKDPVDGFIVNYGYQRNNLEFMEKVYTPDVDTFHDPKLGEVFRYTLQNTPPDKTIYVAISAFIGDTVSDRSEIFEVTPDE